VHVVRDFATRAPRKTHAPLTITVNSGLLWSVEKADHPASICKGAGRGVGPLLFAKVRVAGSNPVVRSKESPASGGARGRIRPLVARLGPPRTTFAPHFLTVFGRRAVDPFISCVRVTRLNRNRRQACRDAKRREGGRSSEQFEVPVDKRPL